MSSTEFVPPVVLSVTSGLDQAGDTLSCQGRIDLDQVSSGGRDFVLQDGLHYDVALTNTGDGILATGIVRGTATAACDRCLDPTQVDIAGEVSCYYLREQPAQDEDDDEDEQEFGTISNEGTVDLSGAIQSAVAMDLPYVVLCDEDCKGLCPVCGVNLNHEQCDCAKNAPTAPGPTNPFAALAALKLDDEGDEGDAHDGGER